MYDSVTADIHGYGIDVAIVTYLDVSEIEIPGFDEVQINRPSGTVTCNGYIFDVGIPSKTDEQSVNRACRIVDTCTSGAFHGYVRRTRAILGWANVMPIDISAQCQLVDE